jgi:hypothetical protein
MQANFDGKKHKMDIIIIITTPTTIINPKVRDNQLRGQV